MTARWWSGKPLPVADAGLPLKWRNKEQHEAAASAATIFRMLLSEPRMAIEPHCGSIWNFALPQNAAITAKFHSSRSEKGTAERRWRGCWELRKPLSNSARDEFSVTLKIAITIKIDVTEKLSRKCHESKTWQQTWFFRQTKTVACIKKVKSRCRGQK